jgi:hypothetical protein
MPIDGDFSVQTDGLGLVALFAANIDRSTGRLSTQARIGGTLGAPDLQGELQLREVELDVYRVNFALRNLNLDARLTGDKLEFEGSAKAGEGSANLSGQMAWRDRKPYGKLHLEGSDLAIVNIPEARVHASPKVDFQIAGQSIDISGEVRLPYGVLEPATITNAVLGAFGVLAGLTYAVLIPAEMAVYWRWPGVLSLSAWATGVSTRHSISRRRALRPWRSSIGRTCIATRCRGAAGHGRCTTSPSRTNAGRLV